MHFRGDHRTVFAKIDGSKNEVLVEGVRVRGYPTFYMFPSTDKQRPVEYEGDRTAKDFIRFVNQFRKMREKKDAAWQVEQHPIV